AAVVAAAFLRPAFFAWAASDAALFNAQRFFVASLIAFLPAALILRLRFATFGAVSEGTSDSPLILAHLAFWAAAIFRRAAAENFFRFRVGTSASAVAAVLFPPPNRLRSSAI